MAAIELEYERKLIPFRLNNSAYYASNGTNMKIHEFALVLTADPNEEESNRLYEAFDDGTLVTSVDVPKICFHREASSLEEAIGSALVNVQLAGFDVIRVEIEPDVMAREIQLPQTQPQNTTT